jgi:hypothetical protein
VSRVGAKRFVETPGVYGEFSLIDEIELTRRRQWGTIDTLVNINDLVMGEQDRLLMRRLDRIETIIWTLLTTGTFSVAGPTGTTLHTASYTTQTYSAGVAWGTSATATPLADFRAVALLGRGYSVMFNQDATAYMNQGTLNKMLTNTNSADLFGRRTAGLGTYNTPGQVSQLLQGDLLPSIQVYEGGYYDSSNTWQKYIPDNKVVVIGRRPSGVPIGKYMMTRNANNPGSAPGAYTKVIDRGEDAVPRSVEVHDGHSGGPALLFPSSVVLMSV